MNYVFLYGNIFFAALNTSSALEMMERGNCLVAAVGFVIAAFNIACAWLAWREIWTTKQN